MRILFGEIQFEFFELHKIEEAKIYAQKTNGSIYSWKTTGKSNWLEKRLSIVDVIGLAIMPKDLPDWINLPDDIEI